VGSSAQRAASAPASRFPHEYTLEGAKKTQKRKETEMERGLAGRTIAGRHGEHSREGRAAAVPGTVSASDLMPSLAADREDQPG
jgi:hypothetical protein